MSDVFISYSRKDTDFVRRIFDDLNARGREAWVDWQGIDYSTKWWEEICAGIEGADNFVLILSPDSLNSVYCHREIEHARKHNKRIIPFIYRAWDEKSLVGGWYTVPDMRPHEAMARENWESLQAIQYIDYPGKLNADFERSMAALLATVDTDPERVRLHTRLILRIRDWEARGRSPSALLRGDELVAYEDWLTKTDAANDEPRATDDQRAYIVASRRAEDESIRKAVRQRRLTWSLVVASIILGVFLIATFLAGLKATMQFSAASTQVAIATVAQGQAIAAQNTSAAREVTANAQVALFDRQISVMGATATNIAQDVVMGERQIESLRLLTLATEQYLDENGNFETAALLAIRALNTANNQQSADTLKLVIPQLYTQQIFRQSGYIEDMVVSPDGHTILVVVAEKLSLHTHNKVHVWNTEIGQERLWEGNQIEDVTAATFSPDSQFIITGNEDGKVSLWRLNTGELFTTFDGQSDAITSIAVSPDQRFIVTGSKDKKIGIWNFEGQHAPQFLSNNTASITSVAVSPNSRLIAASGGDGSVYFWNSDTGVPSTVVLKHQFPVSQIAFSPNGLVLITMSDIYIRLWDVETGNLILGIQGSGRVLSAAFSPDGNLIATSDVHSARIWDLNLRRDIRVLEGDTSPIRRIGYSRTGLYTISSDGYIRTWKIQLTDTENLRILWGSTGDAILLTARSRFINPLRTEGVDSLKNMKPMDLVLYACTRIFRDFTPAERAQYSLDDSPTCPQFAAIPTPAS